MTQNEFDEIRNLLDDFVRWSEAYPTDIFPEPNFAQAHRLLLAGGMTLDAISAAIMRRATQIVGRRARETIARLEGLSPGPKAEALDGNRKRV